MKRKIIFFLLITLSGIIYSQQKVVGYLPYYRGVNSNFDYSKYTHLHYFAIWPATDGSFVYPGSMDSTSMANGFQQIANSVANSDTKMIMTFGGTAENGSEHYINMAKNSVSRANFVNNVKALALAWNCDGIDIDWEWAQHTDTQTSSKAYADLMTDLRAMCNTNNLTLSVDVSPSSWNGKFYPPASIKLADYVNVMAYSYNGAWASTTAHHSPIGKVVNVGLAYWESKGISKEKMNLGTPFYGLKYEGASEVGKGFSSTSGVTYTQISNYINSGYTVVEDSVNGTYCYSAIENSIIFYDSPKAVGNKVRYSFDNGYGGVIIWEVGQDNNSQTLSKAIVSARDLVLNISNDSVEKIEPKLMKVYNLQGAEVSVDTKDEVLILKYEDGSTKKIVNK